MKPKKLSKFVGECIEKSITSPTDIKTLFEAKYPTEEKKTLACYCMALKRAGLTTEKKTAIQDAKHKEQTRDILEYPQVRSYIKMAESGRVQQKQIRHQTDLINKLWLWMNKTNPETWTFETITTAIEQHYTKTMKNGSLVWEHPSAVSDIYSAYNTMFTGRLGRGFSSGLERKAGELKDFFTFAEFDEFILNLTDTEEMPLEGWKALYKAQVNMGCREGTDEINGILGLKWSDIDFTTRRCSLHEKGGRGDASRIWKNLPLDLFPWLNGWNDLITWRDKGIRFKSDRVFSVTYEQYLAMFHATRKRANGRISGTSETLRPHILRKTHAQWLTKLRYPLEQICGQFPYGRLGVGWDNPQIVLKFYIDIESDEYDKADERAKERMKVLGLA